MQDQIFPCAVCSQPARGFHFGAFTCEGCKSFFGRTCLKQNQTNFECRSDGKCNVQGDNRTSCKYCRYQTCIRAGMSPMNSRFGRRSKYFKVTMLKGCQTTPKDSTAAPSWPGPCQDNAIPLLFGQNSPYTGPALPQMPLLGVQSIFLGQLLLALCQNQQTTKNIA